jgi:3',5'-cyclic AMP phosphodiesterase CpdA
MTRLLCACAVLSWWGNPVHAEVPLAPSTHATRLALISDLHVQQCTNDDLAEIHGRFHRAITEINAAKVDLVLIAGDLTEFGRPDEFAALRKHLLDFTAPVWYVPGNHDVGNKITEGRPTEKNVNAWRVRFYEGRMGPSFFTRSRAGVRVIGINGPIMESGLPCERKMWAMLEKELAQPSDQPTIVLIHYPPFFKVPDEPGGDYWNVEPGARKRLLPLLEQGGVKTVLSGHIHTQRINRNKGILFVTTPPVSFGLPKGKQPEGWMLITVPRQGEAQVEFRRVRTPSR